MTAQSPTPNHWLVSPLAWTRIVPAAFVLVELLAEHDRLVHNHFGLVLALDAAILLGNIVLLPLRWISDQLFCAGILVIAAAAAAYSTVQPDSWAIVLPYFSVALAARRLSLRLAVPSVLLCIASVLITQLVRHTGVGSLAITTAVGAVIVTSMIARRARIETGEQTQLAEAREQTAAEEHARAAALAERARIARELHDVLAHSLSALSLNLQGARLMLIRDGASEEAVAQIERAQRLATDGLAEARQAVATLRDDRPPSASRTIADLVTTTRLESGAEVRLTVEGTVRDLSSAADAALHRTTQEALTNSRKYAPGAPVDVLLSYQQGRTVLTVTDHPGHPPVRANPGGYGLTGMRERAELIGGELTTGPTEDGWQVRLEVPS